VECHLYYLLSPRFRCLLACLKYCTLICVCILPINLCCLPACCREVEMNDWRKRFGWVKEMEPLGARSLPFESNGGSYNCFSRSSYLLFVCEFSRWNSLHCLGSRNKKRGKRKRKKSITMPQAKPSQFRSINSRGRDADVLTKVMRGRVNAAHPNK
jgi:hypothetical protein